MKSDDKKLILMLAGIGFFILALVAYEMGDSALEVDSIKDAGIIKDAAPADVNPVDQLKILLKGCDVQCEPADGGNINCEAICNM